MDGHIIRQDADPDAAGAGDHQFHPGLLRPVDDRARDVDDADMSDPARCVRGDPM